MNKNKKYKKLLFILYNLCYDMTYQQMYFYAIIRWKGG